MPLELQRFFFCLTAYAACFAYLPLVGVLLCVLDRFAI